MGVRIALDLLLWVILLFFPTAVAFFSTTHALPGGFDLRRISCTRSWSPKTCAALPPELDAPSTLLSEVNREARERPGGSFFYPGLKKYKNICVDRC